MSKYGELIKQARNPEHQKANQPEDQGTEKPDSQIPSQPVNQIAAPDLTKEMPEPEIEVNLCVKVPVSLRRHWAAEAKRQGLTMTAVIVEALAAKFGKPD